MDEASARLRNRMLRDAIVDVLRECPVAGPDGGGLVIDLVRRVTVDGDRARIELAAGFPAGGGMTGLAGEVRRRVESLPEVSRAHVTVVPGPAVERASHS